MRFSWEQKLPMVFQTEAAECGLACLAMIAGYHGLRVDLPALRHRFSVSLRVELEDLAYLKAPCILHWKMEHFVVLKKVTRKYVYLHDPAVGPRRVSFTEASRHFTGVALELTPTP